MLSENIIREQLSDYLKNRRLFIVDLKISTHNQIDLTIDGDDYVNIECCAEVSRFIESRLDRSIEDFSLVVSSPDATKSLKFARQYPKHIGKDFLIQTNDDKEYKGKLVNADDAKITLLIKTKEKQNNKKKIIEQELHIPFSDIKNAKVLLPF